MRLIVLLLGLFLLLVIIFSNYKDKNISKNILLLTIFLYFSQLISFNFADLPFFEIPIGILIGFICIQRVPEYKKKIYKLSLFFSLIFFVFIHYLTPSIPIKLLNDSINMYQQASNFEEITTIETHSKNDKIQKELTKYIETGKRKDLPMILTYVLSDQDIKIKDRLWLRAEAPTELNIYLDLLQNNDDYTVISASYKNFDYVAYINLENPDSPYMKYIIKGKLKK